MAKAMTMMQEVEDLASCGFAPYTEAPAGNLPSVARPAQVVALSEMKREIITARHCEVERDEAKVMARIKVAAAAAGDRWYYSFPVKNRKRGTTDTIEGASIKCANAVSRIYGNCDIDCRIVDTGDSWLLYARFVDYQTGYSLTRPFQQRKGQVMMGKDADRALDMLLSLGVSKAERNVNCNALQEFTDFAKDEAKNNLIEKVGKNLKMFRDKVKTRLDELGVDIKRVEHSQGRAFSDWLASDVAKIIAQIKSVTDGMATAKEMWAPDAPAEPQRGDAEQPKAEGEPDAPPVKHWKPEGVGQQDIVEKICNLFSLAAEPAEVDEIEKQNAERVSRFTKVAQATIEAAANERRDELAKERTEPTKGATP
jgi:hypothetical protein